MVGDTAAEVKAAVGDGSAWGLEVTYLQQQAPSRPGPRRAHRRRVPGDDDFVMYLGDNLLQQDLGDFVARFEAQRSRATAPQLGDEEPVLPAAQILLAEVEDPQQFGVAELDSAGHVLRLVEKPAVPASDLALVGVYLFDRKIHEAVRSIKPSGRGELEITDAIQWLIDAGHMVLSEILAGLVDRHREADAAPRSQPAAPGGDRTARRRRRGRRKPGHRPGGGRGGRPTRTQSCTRAGHRRGRYGGDRQLHRPLQRDRRGLL